MYLSAYEEYKSSLHDAKQVTHAILEALDNAQHKAEIEINWGDVGSMNHIKEELAEILRFMRGEEEYQAKKVNQATNDEIEPGHDGIERRIKPSNKNYGYQPKNDIKNPVPPTSGSNIMKR